MPREVSLALRGPHGSGRFHVLGGTGVPTLDWVRRLAARASTTTHEIKRDLVARIATGLDAMGGLAVMAAMYASFVERHQPVLAQLRADSEHALDEESAFLLRILLIHDYRRLLLRDPELPDVLLPGDWPGHQARQLCREIYHRLLPASERHLDRHFQLANGQTPEASPTVYARFGEVDPLS